jgi:hypothetical protein
MTQAADTTVIASVLTWLESHPARNGFPVALEDEPPEGTDGLMLLSIPGEGYVKRYKSGGHVASFPFAVVRRTNNPDTQTRLDVMGQLGDIVASIESRTAWPTAPEGFDYQSLEVRTQPARVARSEAGADDYQATFTLMYRKRG